MAYPDTPEDVALIVGICNTHNCPVIGWGAGTSLEGQTTPVRGGITVDFSRMNRVISVNAQDMTVRVEPGITRQELNTQLRDTGLFFPVDPGANATLGGMASTRASGTTAVRYGTMRDNLLGLNVVTADGIHMRTGSAAPKSSAGYDLTSLFVGSEGTLGLITELTLKLHGIPEHTAAAVCTFDDMGPAVEAVMTTIQMAVPMARIEFVDAATAGAFNAYAGASWPEKPHLMVEFHGSETAVAEASETFGGIVDQFGGADYKWASLPEDSTALWAMMGTIKCSLDPKNIMNPGKLVRLN